MKLIFIPLLLAFSFHLSAESINVQAYLDTLLTPEAKKSFSKQSHFPIRDSLITLNKDYKETLGFIENYNILDIQSILSPFLKHKNNYLATDAKLYYALHLQKHEEFEASLSFMKQHKDDFLLYLV